MHANTSQGDLVSLLLFFENKESSAQEDWGGGEDYSSTILTSALDGS
jgi:hypothetical protein